MMHSNDFVVAILYNGSFIEESKGGVVALPFGAEYKIRLRNKHKDRRALATVFIDEENISGGGVIVPANKFIDLETSPANPGRKFKIVSANSSEAVDAGKNNKSDDSNGVIRVEWQLEKVVYVDRPVPYYPLIIKPYPWRPYDPYFTNIFCGSGQGSNSDIYEDNCCNFAEEPTPRSLLPKRLQEACTVEGSRSTQTFYNAHIDTENTTTTIRIILRGYNASVGMQTQQKHCENCGARRKNRKAKFCWDCGKALSKYGVCV